ncbi:hypothetical protein TBR22_A08230 [Luteitalea sp. TBR-22]|uniref:hypothetical protein n=1 Tax=Luteitalea sp. TBR-22 TaxID=2802971 RepID=UPI001AFA8DC1|nr:hypothetical protein [Luteitalea sp. TBR-22]BCS31621.1 hypothetical protein TBR22_A08230 [Luteitalea sp. TBR-22]
MLETAEVRRQLTHRLAELKKAQAQRRASADAARTAFDAILEREIAPTMRQFAQALKAEGFAFSVQTPAGAARLVSDRSSDNAIDVFLEVGGAQPAVIVRSAYSRGRRQLEDERTLAQGEAIGRIDGERVLAVLLDVIEPFVER